MVLNLYDHGLALTDTHVLKPQKECVGRGFLQRLLAWAITLIPRSGGLCERGRTLQGALHASLKCWETFIVPNFSQESYRQ